MPADGASLLNVQSSENNRPGQPQRLSRSPHPYHRHRSTLLQDDGNLILRSSRSPATPKKSSQEPTYIEAGDTYFDADHRKRRKHTSSPSDSGTEADDERGGTLLGLPAPPSRLRKGLKGSNNAGTASPLLTPSYLDEEPRRLVLKAQTKRRASLQGQSCTDEETKKLREKFTRRRRAELIRRTSEITLIGMVGFIACRKDIEWLIYGYAHEPEGIALANAPLALLSHAAAVISLYILYPLRIIYKNNALSISKGRSRFYIHIPAAFDPAPLLYPILIPVFGALLLSRTDTTFLLPNLILSVASIPSKIVPMNADVPWYNSVQWLLSMTPVASQQWHSSNCHETLSRKDSSPCRPKDTNLALLYPLHQALIPVLGYLTTTSLLPAELQLLSISMINLILHAESPQTIILQSLLWIGGLSIFVSCGKVLTWGVALARIPSWRFRRRHVKARGTSVVLAAIEDCFNGRLRRGALLPTHPSDSDDSGSSDSRNIIFRERRKHRKMLSVDTRRRGIADGGTVVQLRGDPATAAMQKVDQPWVLGSNDSLGLNLGHRHQRRFTLPSSIGCTPTDTPKESLKRSMTTHHQRPKAWSLRSFSEAQAIVVKWVIALYVYSVVAIVIAFVVRDYVARNALYGQEPVGWALGYLAGNITFFHQVVMDWGLDGWIHLPKDSLPLLSRQHYGLAYLQSYLGAANIRLLICAYCMMIIAAGLIVVFRLSNLAEVDTRRKVFHGMMVAMFLPTIFVDPIFVSLAFSLILAIFLLLDLFRASQLPPLSKPLTLFLAPYVDGRDHRGPVIVSHIFLLIGCAIPLWLSLAGVPRTGQWPWEGWDVERREMSMISGVVCVGMGDAAASLIGRRYGRRRWCWSGGKSLEGSLAFATAVLLGLSFARLWLVLGGWDGDNGDSWATTLGKASVAALGASLTEAVLTGGNDNVIVPVILWLLVRGLRI